MSNISEATQHDWEDFWHSPEKFGTWYSTDFEKVWKDVSIRVRMSVHSGDCP
jgi:hypothetical protein